MGASIDETAMQTTLHYVFDPLCGWCYGASATLAAIAAAGTVRLGLLPSGLFQGPGARAMDDGFAAYAWSNDQRIERLSGQIFSPCYRDEVLANREQRFDSGPATLALTAVHQTAPEREMEALKAIQQARYVEGRDITRTDVLAEVLQALGLSAAAQALQGPRETLVSAADARIAEAQALMRRFGARGVPSFVLEDEGRQQLVHASAVYSDPRAFMAQLQAVA